MNAEHERRIRALEAQLADLRSAGRPLYVEGTWTPTYLGGTTPGVTTYTLQQGGYVRIGRAVLFTLTVAWSAATGTGIALYSLPFAVANVTNQYFSAAVRTSDVTFAAGAPVVEMAPGQQVAYLRYPTSNAPIADIAVEAAGNVIMSGWYLTE